MSDPAPFSRPARLGRGRIWLVSALLVVAAASVAAGFRRGGDALRHLTAKVQRGEIRDAVEATGTVNAVITVQVGSQVSGRISRLDADFNSPVRKGQTIALIDPQLFQAALAQAVADLENAKANVVAAESSLAKAEAARVQTEADYERARALTREEIGSQQALDLARANFDSARAGVAGASAAIVQAKAQLSQKEAAVGIARINLDYTVIRSPIDGVVVARNVDVGQTVAASLQAPTIFTIAQDLTKMLVYAKVDESDVGRIRIGQPVTFKVDAFPKEQFSGVVTQIRMNPTMVQNVVTYDAIVTFDNPRLELFPGMTAYVTIPVATVRDAIKLPNAALRYKPPLSPEAVRALYARYRLEEDAARDASPSGAAGAAPRRPQRRETAIVWKPLQDGSLEPVQVALGITDHTFTEVTDVLVGTLAPGDDVVTTSIAAKSLPPGAQGLRR